MPPPPRRLERCAAHPGRPAVDDCPVCSRPRCGSDAKEALGGGCAICHGVVDEPARVPPTRLELVVRGVVGANLTAIAWGFVEAEYVQASFFEYAAPAILGAFVGGVALAASGQPRGEEGTRMRLIAVLYAVLGCAFGFVKEGTFGALSTSGDVVIPYVIAALACWLWTLPPKES